MGGELLYHFVGWEIVKLYVDRMKSSLLTRRSLKRPMIAEHGHEVKRKKKLGTCRITEGGGTGLLISYLKSY